MSKTCKNICEKSYNQFNKRHFKPKNQKNDAFINSTEALYNKTCKRFCKQKSSPKKKRKQSKKKRKTQKGGFGILPQPFANTLNMATFIPSQFVNSLYGFKSLVSPISSLSQFSFI